MPTYLLIAPKDGKPRFASEGPTVAATPVAFASPKDRTLCELAERAKLRGATVETVTTEEPLTREQAQKLLEEAAQKHPHTSTQKPAPKTRDTRARKRTMLPEKAAEPQEPQESAEELENDLDDLMGE